MEQFMIALLLVLLAAWGFGIIAIRLGFPAMLGELMAGILLGPPLLGWLPADPGLLVMAEVGIFVMMLYVGAEIDPKDMIKASKAGFLAAIGGFVVPFVAGAAVTWAFINGTDLEPRKVIIGALFVGICCAGTSLASKSRILLDLKLLDTRIALVMMCGALVADTAMLVVFAGITGFAEGTVSVEKLAMVLVKALIFFAICIGLGVKVFPHIQRLLEKLGLKGLTATLTVLLITALAFGELAHLLGLHNILGAFMAGMFLREAVKDRHQYAELTHRIHDMAIGFLAPIFFVTAGFAFNFGVFSSDLPLLIAVTLTAVVGKVVGTALFYLPSGNGWREGVTIGFGMNGRGAVDIIVAGIALGLGLIEENLYSVIVFMAVSTTLMVPVTLKLCISWLDRHDQLVRISERLGYILVGAGPLARLLGKMLSEHEPVKLIDRNPDQIRAAEKDGLTAVRGNALDEATMTDANALGTSSLLAVTPNYELNMMAAQFANEKFLVPNRYVLLGSGHKSEYADVIANHEMHPLFHQGLDLSEWDRYVARGQYTIETERLRDETSIADLQAQVASGTLLPLTVQRGEKTTPVSAAMPLEADDVITLLKPRTGDTIQVDKFDRLVAMAPFFDLDRAMALDEFLAEAAETLVKPTELDVKELTELFMARELDSGTVMGQGVAIPHIVLPGENQLHLVVARCREGIAFGPGDEDVHTVFMMASTRDQRNMHLRCLSAIAQIVQSRQFEANWFEADNTEELRQLLLTAKRRRF